MKCWCGTRRPYFETSPALLSSSCAGTGELDCLCGGDQCVCHNHGTVDCPGCPGCAKFGDSDADLVHGPGVTDSQWRKGDSHTALKPADLPEGGYVRYARRQDCQQRNLSLVLENHRLQDALDGKDEYQ